MTKQQEKFALAVCGAHLEGLPLNHQLTELGAKLKVSTETTPNYEMFVLPNQSIDKPGMFRSEKGQKIIVEVWELPIENVGAFLSQVKQPLGLGEIELNDGTWVHGFVCNPYDAIKGQSITELGGWKAYLASK